MMPNVIISIVLYSFLSLAVASPASKVVGGTNAIEGEFPYQVSLQNNVIGHFCGGSIIGDIWVITAAHCYEEDCHVVAGEHDLSVEIGNEQRHKVVQFILHEGYPGGLAVAPDDIALVRVEAPFEFNSIVKRINLPKPYSNPIGDAILSGWGSTSRTNDHHYPDILQKAVLPIHSDLHCFLLLIGHPFATTNICAGPLSGSRAICSGDSGGPLAQKINGEFTLVGIVSWGPVPCGEKNKPGVFVQVSKYIDWITDQILISGF